MNKDIENEFITMVLEELLVHFKELEGFISDKKVSFKKEFIDELFRVFHSIKGSSKSANLTSISTLSHSFETMLVAIKDKKYSKEAEFKQLFKEVVLNFLILQKKYLEDFDSTYDITPLLLKINNELNIKDLKNTKLKILLVDDEVDILEIFEDLALSIHDYEVFKATNGQKAYDYCLEYKFEIILSDFKMPVMNGIEFISKIRKANINKFTPVVFISGFQPKVDTEEAKWNKVFFVKKPFSLKKLSFYIKCAHTQTDLDEAA